MADIHPLATRQGARALLDARFGPAHRTWATVSSASAAHRLRPPSTMCSGGAGPTRCAAQDAPQLKVVGKLIRPTTVPVRRAGIRAPVD